MDQPLSLDELLEVDAPHTYLVQASGDSMTGVGIFDGELMVVNRKLDLAPGHIVIAVLNAEVCVKRLTKRGEMFVLESANPKYPPRYILEGDEFEVWGVGQRMKEHLALMGMKTAWDLAQADALTLRKRHSVVIEKTAREQRGVACLDLEDGPAPK